MVERRHFQLVSWELEDGEEIHREAPSTFWIPSEERRTSLSQGDIVKLIFRMTVCDPAADDAHVEVERMWVIVEEREGVGYRGALDNDPYCTSDLISGAVVRFEPRHIIQIYDEDAK